MVVTLMIMDWRAAGQIRYSYKLGEIRLRTHEHNVLYYCYEIWLLSYRATIL